MSDRNHNPSGTSNKRDDKKPPSGASVSRSQQRQQQQSRIPRPTAGSTTPARLRAVAGGRLKPAGGDTQQAFEEPNWDTVDQAEVSQGSKEKATDMAGMDRKAENFEEDWEFLNHAEASGEHEEKDTGKQTEGQDEKVAKH